MPGKIIMKKSSNGTGKPVGFLHYVLFFLALIITSLFVGLFLIFMFIARRLRGSRAGLPWHFYYQRTGNNRKLAS
jgi:hypothetical protein